MMDGEINHDSFVIDANYTEMRPNFVLVEIITLPSFVIALMVMLQFGSFSLFFNTLKGHIGTTNGVES